VSQTAESTDIQSVLQETRVFDPPKEIVGKTYINTFEEYKTMWQRSVDSPDEFWAEIADQMHWFKKWDKVSEWNLPDTKWFLGGKTNISYNCIDRQIDDGLGDQLAIIWEGEPMPDGKPEVRKLTYNDLKREVSKTANVLKDMGVKKGDRVTIYLGMVPELAIAMLACARIGAPHSIIFGGFSATAISDRVQDAESSVIITGDGAWRRGKVVPLKDNVDEACDMSGDIVKHVLVLKRCENDCKMVDGRDVWWHDSVDKASDDCPAEHMDSEDLLFLLYTSGTTGKPKGIMHTTGGYMVYTYLTSKYIFNLKQNQDQLYWCTADIGWVTGHSYIVYGILPNRVPSFMFEGAPNFPAEDRFWDVVERHKVTQFYTAPTAIRAFMKWGDDHVTKHDLSSLQVLGTVGEPINPEAWSWYHSMIGSEKCPIVDTWWQTETGGILITPLPGCTPTKPGSCTLPFFGIDPAIVDEEGTDKGLDVGGLLAVRKPWPSMLRGIYGARERFIETYFSRVKGMYFSGDGARRDKDGYFWIMGRVDDVINVSGHRLGTMEVESALVSHETVAEAAVVGMPHEIKGTGIAAFVTVKSGIKPTDELKKDLLKHVVTEIGAIARPDQLRFTDALPKTRSGKIMRRLLREIAAGKVPTGDTTTLEDFNVLAKLSESEES